MQDDAETVEVLTVFAHYGFRKASMDDLARAAGVSRQTLYSRFKTKEGVLDWAVEGFLNGQLERASAALEQPKVPVEKCLLEAFARWTGDLVPMMDAPHGSEALDLGEASLQRLGVDPHAAFEKALIAFLKDRGVAKTPKQAGELAYLLVVASKGLMIKCATPQDFDAGMKRVLKAVL